MFNEARYLYSVVKTGHEARLGSIGIQENDVYIVPYKDIAAIVHACEAKPYHTEDKKLAEDWVLEHSYVIDQATKLFGTVLPFSFDVIIKGNDDAVRDWLCRDYENLAGELLRMQGTAEYSIQIYSDHACLETLVLERNQELVDLKSRIEKEPKGKAYLLKRNLDMKLKNLSYVEAGELANRFCSEIKPLVEELKVAGKASWTPDKYRDKKLLATFSCRVSDEAVKKLGEVLEEINCKEGFYVRFTGPWAPFSFVCLSGAG
ncbi:MAG: GvpL/GvpF family gas vesicle protein [Euryarchaeota archaeon]|nr:GvpL/GvpF family gas vesicle protein [Euryarchaeota archaeon]